jgi:DNA-binding transcriptional ArsR family regulator
MRVDKLEKELSEIEWMMSEDNPTVYTREEIVTRLAELSRKAYYTTLLEKTFPQHDNGNNQNEHSENPMSVQDVSRYVRLKKDFLQEESESEQRFQDFSVNTLMSNVLSWATNLQ